MKYFAEIQVKIKYELNTYEGYTNDLGIVVHDANEMLEVDLEQINNIGISEFLELMPESEVIITSSNIVKE